MAEFSIFFPKTFDPGQYKLFEVTDDIIEEIRNGASIQTDTEAYVYLCTKNKTYGIDGLEFSNTEIVVENTGSILTMFDCLHELKVVKPDFTKLRDSLINVRYDGTNLDHCPKITDVVNLYASSEKEFYSFLKSIHAIVIDTRVCLLNYFFMFSEFNLIFELLHRNFDLTQPIHVDMIREKCIHDISPELLLHLLEQISDSKDDFFLLSIDKFTMFRANQHLISAANDLTTEQIHGKITNELDERGITYTNATYLENPLTLFGFLLTCNFCYVTDINSMTISYISPLDLPLEAEALLMRLFQIKTKWSLRELTPFIKPLLSGRNTTETVINKHCRKVFGGGAPNYVLRS
ncbi:hypothetical protein PCE1_000843 [Barthelona sp. PCE]